ncbi:MAG: DUF4345 family protein [Chloroflexi bacterium]|nr:DUF4345 family protein [Chloroflexota bacterium]
MSFLAILKLIVALLTIATGVLSLVKPKAIYGFTGLKAEGARGLSEIRAIFGGLFIALGAAPLILGGTAYQVLGIGYLAIALTRSVSILIDHSRASSNLISLATEIVCGVILILGY